MPFDFQHAVTAPFRMQPGLRRVPALNGVKPPVFTPLAPGGRHQREKLAVLSAFWPDALLREPAFDAGPALQAACSTATAEHPQVWTWDGQRAQALALGVAVDAQGQVQALASGVFGLGDEVPRCLAALPAEWRLAALLALSFVEDLAVIDLRSGRIPWLSVLLPSHWAPADKLGLDFAAVHEPVADKQLLLRAAPSILQLLAQPGPWERFVWSITDHPWLHAHPARVALPRWADTPVQQALWRTEHQRFTAVPGTRQMLFSIHTELRPLAQLLASASAAAALHAAVASMSDAVISYRGLGAVREALLQWLAVCAAASDAPTPAPHGAD